MALTSVGAHCARNSWFLAVGVIALIIFIREQVLGLVSLALLGAQARLPHGSHPSRGF